MKMKKTTRMALHNFILFGRSGQIWILCVNLGNQGKIGHSVHFWIFRRHPSRGLAPRDIGNDNIAFWLYPFPNSHLRIDADKFLLRTLRMGSAFNSDDLVSCKKQNMPLYHTLCWLYVFVWSCATISLIYSILVITKVLAEIWLQVRSSFFLIRCQLLILDIYTASYFWGGAKISEFSHFEKQ